MKRKINLLTKQKKYLQVAKIFGSLRLVIVVTICFFLVLFATLYFFLSRQSGKINEIQEQKKKVLNYLVKNKEVEAQFIYFRNKQQDISEILKNDVNFYPYYMLLTNSLKSSSPSATLVSLMIDKDKSVDFTVSFDSLNSLLAFFKFTESPSFLNNFDTLNLIGLNLTQQVKNDFKLNFKGKFVKLNEITN